MSLRAILTTGRLGARLGNTAAQLAALIAGTLVSLRTDRLRIIDATDTTKQIAWGASLIATGTTRTYTLPDTSGTIPVLSLAQTWTSAQTGTAWLANGNSGIGYATGAGGTVTQATSRTTGVTINKATGAITLVSAAGSTSWQSFTVTNSAVAATDSIILNQVSGSDLYEMQITQVNAGSFRVTFRTTGGTTTEQPVIRFTVLKSVSA